MASIAHAFFMDYVFSTTARRPGSGTSDTSSGTQPAVGASQCEWLRPQEFNHRMRELIPKRGERFSDDEHNTCMYIERSKNLNVVAYTANFTEDHKGGIAAAATAESGGGTTTTTPVPQRLTINAKDPVKACWIKIEPEHVARRRARGDIGDKCDLSLIEKTLAYGCTASSMSLDKLCAEVLPKSKAKEEAEKQRKTLEEWHAIFQPCVAKYVALPKLSVIMLALPPVSEEEEEGEEVEAEGKFSPKETIPVMLACVDKKLSIVEKVYVASIEPKHFYQLPSVEYIDLYGVSLETGKATYERMSK